MPIHHRPTTTGKLWSNFVLKYIYTHTHQKDTNNNNNSLSSLTYYYSGIENFPPFWFLIVCVESLLIFGWFDDALIWLCCVVESSFCCANCSLPCCSITQESTRIVALTREGVSFSYDRCRSGQTICRRCFLGFFSPFRVWGEFFFLAHFLSHTLLYSFENLKTRIRWKNSSVNKARGRARKNYIESQ